MNDLKICEDCGKEFTPAEDDFNICEECWEASQEDEEGDDDDC